MTRKEIIDKMENIEREMKEIREYLSQSETRAIMPVDFPLAPAPHFKLGYTLEDMYREFGCKKSLAHRLKMALQKRNIKTPCRPFT